MCIVERIPMPEELAKQDVWYKVFVARQRPDGSVRFFPPSWPYDLSAMDGYVGYVTYTAQAVPRRFEDSLIFRYGITLEQQTQWEYPVGYHCTPTWEEAKRYTKAITELRYPLVICKVKVSELRTYGICKSLLITPYPAVSISGKMILPTTCDITPSDKVVCRTGAFGTMMIVD